MKFYSKQPLQNPENSTSVNNLPFMFSVGANEENSTSSSDRKREEITKNALKIKTSFKKELQKLGIPAKLIPEKNPFKETASRNNSPTIGLPYQRRTRSSSPPKENLIIVDKENRLFEPRSPVIVSHKINVKEDFSLLWRESGCSEVVEDEDLKNLKEEYIKMLEGAEIEYCEGSSEDIEEEGNVVSMDFGIGVKSKKYFD